MRQNVPTSARQLRYLGSRETRNQIARDIREPGPTHDFSILFWSGNDGVLLTQVISM